MVGGREGSELGKPREDSLSGKEVWAAEGVGYGSEATNDTLR